ncbi:hypothetical protein NKI36_18840 [Mesorhizobium caraganae]|uniref:Uncharacterized protein n=1 Tax=Mesorhizobium caraganae TaxID=483206 RepID=A0ABV1Z2C7_9HYPH
MTVISGMVIITTKGISEPSLERRNCPVVLAIPAWRNLVVDMNAIEGGRNRCNLVVAMPAATHATPPISGIKA